MLYHPVSKKYTRHYTLAIEFLESQNHLHVQDRRVVTIGRFINDRPVGLAWQWRSRRILEGFLYGEVNSHGQFTGDNITYVYPDMVTGLRDNIKLVVLFNESFKIYKAKSQK